MKTKILFGLSIFLCVGLFVLVGLELSNSDVAINWKKLFSIFHKKEIPVSVRTYLPISSPNFAKIALKKAIEENKFPFYLEAEDVGFFIVDNEENSGKVNLLEDTVTYELAKYYQGKYKFSSIVIICEGGSHFLFSYQDFLKFPDYKRDIYLIEKKKEFSRIPCYIVTIGDSIYLYDTQLRELLRR